MNIKLGTEGERLASSFLRDRGYRILAQNYRCDMGEIDLIAMKEDLIAFVEVKTRRTLAFGRPAEAVGFEKQRHIKRVAAVFLQREAFKYRFSADAEFRFDIIEILYRKSGATITHLRNALI